MNPFDFIADETKLTLGWTLLHTLWQGALLFLAIKIAHWFIPSFKSSLRYALSCCTMALVFLSGTFTYVILQNSAGSNLILSSIASTQYARIENFVGESSGSYWNYLVMQVNDHMPLILIVWIIGVLLFSLRFSIGLLYINFIKRNAIGIDEQWSAKIRQLSIILGIARLVSIAESVHINRPMVIGFIKPMVLLPVGLLAGLSQEQVEAILVHELSHIKRHDYIINIVQAIVEIILFFNPFVWMISKLIRDERENCCDDQVLRSGSNKVVYVKALAQLEENRFSSAPNLAMALSKNRHQVLNRIKRIMESQIANNHGKVRPFTIAAIIMTAVICTSWLSIDSQGKVETDQSVDTKAGSTLIVADTIKDQNKDKTKKDKSEKSATYSRKTITTFDEDGNPHEEVIENFEGDEELKLMLTDPGSSAYTIPAIPSLPDIPSMPSIPTLPYDHTYTYTWSDSIPGNKFFSEEDKEKWEEFGKEMARRFENFGQEHEEFGKQMEEWAESFGNKFTFEFNDQFLDQLDKLHDNLENLRENRNFQQKLDRGLEDMEEQLKLLEENLRAHKDEIRSMEENMDKYEAELHDQLVKDGYLKKDEKVNSMNWGDGTLTINGKKIKDKDVPKYEAINKKYFKGRRGVYIQN